MAKAGHWNFREGGGRRGVPSPECMSQKTYEMVFTPAPRVITGRNCHGKTAVAPIFGATALCIFRRKKV